MQEIAVRLGCGAASRPSLTESMGSLEFDPSLTEGLAFIREEYSELIPENLAADKEPDGRDS